MKLALKKNNRPTEPGHYLCKRPQQARPEVAVVRKEDKGSLTMLHGQGIFPLSYCEQEALWSDALEISLPD
jgi:hypothetical protein